MIGNRLVGRGAIVTGAARGIGLGIARRLAAEGAKVLSVDVLEDALEEASVNCPESERPQAKLGIDLTRADAADQVLEAARSALGTVDILVNNAGVGISGRIEDFTDEQWDRTLLINLTVPFRLARLIVPLMAVQGYGRVLNISSMNGQMGMRGDAAYAASKAGLEALTRSIAADYGRSGVTANAIAPGTIVTPLNRDILGSLDERSPMMRIVVQNKPIAGNGEVADIAEAAAYLVSEEAKFVSAQILAIDGGLSGTRYVPEDPGIEATRYIPKH